MADPWASIYRTASDRRSGAGEIARTAALAVAALDPAEARRAVEVLVSGHPSMAPLWRLASYVLDGPTPAEAAERFLGSLASDEDAAAALTSVLTPWVLTISYSSSVLRALRGCGRLSMVTCMESLPGGEGRQTAEAVSDFARARVVRDEDALKQVPGGVVVVGCDALTPGALVNKIKTRPLAEAARRRNVPCYAVAGWSKFVSQPVPVEELFEPSPLELFTGIATPEGVVSASEAGQRAEGAVLNEELRALLVRLRRER